MQGPGDEFLTNAAFAAYEHGSVGARHATNLFFDRLERLTGADQFAFDVKLSLQGLILVRQPLLTLHLMGDRPKLLRYRHREFKVLRAECFMRIGAIKMDEAQHFAGENHRSANEAGGAEVRQAFPVAQIAIAGHVLRQNGFTAGQHLVRDKLRDATVNLDAWIAMAMGRHLELTALLQGQQSTHFRGHRLEQAIQNSAGQFFRRSSRAHVESQAIEQRQVTTKVASAHDGTLRGRGFIVGHGRHETGLSKTFLDGHALTQGLFQERQIGQLVQRLHKDKRRFTDLKFISRRQLPVALEQGFAVEARAIETFQVPQGPAALGEVNLGVLPAA